MFFFKRIYGSIGYEKPLKFPNCRAVNQFIDLFKAVLTKNVKITPFIIKNTFHEPCKSSCVERKAIGQKYTRRAKIPIFASMTVANFTVLPEPPK